MREQLTGVAVRFVAGIPDGPAQAPGDLGARFNEIVGVAKWFGVAFCLLGFIIAAGMLGFRQHNGRMGDEGFGNLGKAILGAILVVSAPTIIAFFI